MDDDANGGLPCSRGRDGGLDVLVEVRISTPESVLVGDNDRALELETSELGLYTYESY